jgi:hypothetical protein
MLECVKSSRYVWVGFDNAIEIVDMRSNVRDRVKDVLNFEDQNVGGGTGSDGKLGDSELGG